MEAKAMLLLFVVMVIFSQVPLSSSFQWDGQPNDPLVVVIGRNSNNVEFKWKFSPGETSNWSYVYINRTKNEEANTETNIFTYVSSSGTQTPPSDSRFSLTVEVSGVTTVTFVINDITNQTNNQDGTAVDVMAPNVVYSYKCSIITAPNGFRKENIVKLNVFKAPVITTKPNDVMLTGWNSKVEFTCEAEGKPEPEILLKKIWSSKVFNSGKTLTLSSVTPDDIGVYQCTAKNTIADNVTAVASLQQGSCSIGCTSEEIGIQLTDLKYSIEYENSNSKEYQRLKDVIETQCLNEYSSKGEQVFKCQVKKFRSGSVVAVIALSYPSSSSTAPLKSAISDGKFAGHVVNPAFVSPTSAPTEKPPTTLSTRPTEFPGPPEITKVDPKVNEAEVHWNASLSDGGSPVLGYWVQVKTKEGQNTWRNCTRISTSNGMWSCSIGDLESDTWYTVRISARNKLGLGEHESKHFKTNKSGGSSGSKEDKDSKQQTYIIIGVFLGVLLLFVIILLIVKKKWKRPIANLQTELIPANNHQPNGNDGPATASSEDIT